MSNYQYETSSHHCVNAKDPTAIAAVIVPHTVIRSGYVIDPDLAEIVGYRKAAAGVRSMGDICQNGNELEGVEIVALQFDRTNELFLLQLDSGFELPGATGITVTLPSGANFTLSWDAGRTAYVYPYPDPDGELSATGVTMAIQFEVLTGP